MYDEIRNLGEDIEKLIMDYKLDLEYAEDVKYNYFLTLEELHLKIDCKKTILVRRLGNTSNKSISVVLSKSFYRGIEYVYLALRPCQYEWMADFDVFY